jgi:hypothetical protein
VVYASSSSALATGSALTFNGTSLGVGSSSYGDAGTITASIGVPATTVGGLQLWSTTAGTHYVNFGDGTTGSDTYRGYVGYAHASDALIFGAATAEGLRLTSSSLYTASGINVGIGTSSPAYKLDVARSGTGFTAKIGNASTATYFYNDGSSTYIAGDSSVNNCMFISAGTNAIGWTTTNGTVKMLLDASGNLGLGITPTTILDIGANNNTPKTITLRYSSVPTYLSSTFDGSFGLSTFSINSYNTSNSSASWSAFGNSGYASSAVQLASDTNGSQIRFLTASAVNTAPSERARIDSSGNLLVGTTSANAKVTVQTTTNQRSIQLDATDSSTFTDIIIYANGYRNTTNGSWKYLSCAINGVGEKLQIIDSGTVNNATGTYGTISDARLKQDIVDAPSQWSDIKAIRFRKYRMKLDVESNPNAPTMLGVVAQELELVSPNLVDESNNEDGTTTKTVKQSILLMKAAVALQEAMTRIEQLEARLDAANL